jgi:hypothetical protein
MDAVECHLSTTVLISMATQPNKVLFPHSISQGEPGDLGKKGAVGFPGPRGLQVCVLSVHLIWPLESSMESLKRILKRVFEEF